MSDSQVMTSDVGDSYPARLEIDYPESGLSRVKTLFRIILIIPIAIVMVLITGGGYGIRLGSAVRGGILFLPTLLMILFRRKYPRWWFDWNLEVSRFTTRVWAYLGLLRDEYPSTDEEQSVHLDLELSGRVPRPESLAADSQMDSRHSALRRSGRPDRRGHPERGDCMVRDHHHRPLPARPLQLCGRRQPLGLRVSAYMAVLITDRYPRSR